MRIVVKVSAVAARANLIRGVAHSSLRQMEINVVRRGYRLFKTAGIGGNSLYKTVLGNTAYVFIK